MGRKAIEKRDNQLIINIDEIEREQQALMLTKSTDPCEVQCIVICTETVEFLAGVYCEAAEWGDIQRSASGRPAECDGSVRTQHLYGSVGSGGTNIEF